MADKTDCRTTEVLRRAKKRRRLHENHLFAGLSSICITLICGLFCTIVSLNNIPQSDIIIDTYGAVLLYSSAATYVLVALLSFVAGTIITALCIHTKNKNKCIKTNKNDEEKTKWKKDF